MKFKRLFLIGIFLLAVLLVGAVSADDNVTADDSSNTESAIEADVEGNFNDLNNLLENAEEKTEIRLDKNYSYDKNNDSAFKNGLTFEKTLTLNGNGHTISGSGKTIFSKGDNVVMKNIIFKKTRIDSTGSNFKLINCTFIDCSFKKDGGAVYSHSSLYVYSSNFIGCSARDGGAIYSYSKCKIYFSNFSNCSANGDGGAIYKSSSGDMNIRECTFTNSSASYGGAIYKYWTSCSVLNSRFVNSSASYKGGAIYSRYDCNIDGCSFENSSAEYGDAIQFEGEFTLANSSFVNGAWNVDTDRERKIFNVSVDDPTLDTRIFDNIKNNDRISLSEDHKVFSPIRIKASNVLIDGCGHSFTGGQIFYITGKNVTVANCVFENCSNERIYGGAICSEGKCRLVNCSFKDCNAYVGGAVWCEGECDFIGCSFTDCSASSGGAVCCVCDNPNVVNCSFRNSDSEYDNGAIYFGNKFTLINTSFESGAWYSTHEGYFSNVYVNHVLYDVSAFTNLKSGSVLKLKRGYNFLSPVSITAKNVVIDAKGHTITSNGCGAFIINARNVTLKNFNFVDCDSEEGGAVRSNAFNTKILDCTFEGCYGSAVYLKGNSSRVTGCTFRNCDGEGGAIRSSGNDLRVTDSRFISCRSSHASFYTEGFGGAILASGLKTQIKNCYFKQCTSDYSGGAIYFGLGDSSLYNCTFKGCSADYGGAITSRGDSCRIAKSSFTDCRAEYGGAIFSENDAFDLVKCKFKKCSANKIRFWDSEVYYGSYFQAKVNYPEGTVAKGVYVTFKINGKYYKEVKTDKKGYAKVKITKAPGDYTVSIRALGETASDTLTVTSILDLEKVPVKRSAKKLVLKATLKKGKKAIVGKKVTFKFNGKTYSAKTDKKGVAKITVKKSALKKLKAGKKVKYQATYGNCVVKYSVKIEK